MDKWKRRTLLYSAALLAIMFGFAVFYHVGMIVYEGGSDGFLHSLQIVVETFTTTGFGSDAPWSSHVMNLFVIVMDLTGVALIFLAFPVLVFPLLQDALSTTVPRSVDDDLTDHVVICMYTPRAEPLIDELESRAVQYVIVEPDRDQAVDLLEQGYDVVYGDPESAAALEGARLGSARALVADLSDRVDTSIVLTAREVDEDVHIVSILEDPEHANYHRLAGANDVLSPRPLLGRSLASRVTASVSSDLDSGIEIGADFEIAELPVHRGSPLVGETLAGSGIRESTGVNVIGAWFRGTFESPPPPDATITNGTVLLVTGHEKALEHLKERTLSEMRPYQPGDTVVIGYGQVGRTITTVLKEEGLPCTVVDREAHDGVDVVGDATDVDTLHEAGCETARSVILAFPDDTTTEFATLVIREEFPATEIIARADESRNVTKLYRAGADYVSSLATVSGRMIAGTIVEDGDVLAYDKQVEVVRTSAPSLVGRTIGDARVRSQTGCTIIGIDREGAVLTDVGPDVRLQVGDELIIAGTGEGIRRFNELLG
ncbi:K+ transport system, NAD-binding component fusedto Ion channel [Halanaeroarchaeum sp. HSR-CO]|uniref:potassium channel family protein n=1 Tax=Halanaeroarchaeum sp. HSR-CO TaxID=2866382 RepID=UPI00217DA4EF|nr:potassium channel protein [Halanaeroarchaeum sp. HSR-CO]UWG47148.1 K+ transport system, NAD-binding component fusedto Ion channel [Halanaeroarchaeum sp. HSR-CO]